MPAITEHQPGTFCWVELVTSDAPGAKRFYTELFDLSAHDDPIGPGQTYTMLLRGEKHVGALYAMPEEMKSHRVPPHWMSYVSVANADETAKKAARLGGTVVKDPCDVFELGRMAVLRDPTGAHVSIWQPMEAIGAHVVNEPGTLCWNELATHDTRTAERFYTELFGWTASTDKGGYTMFMNGERPAGGMLEISEEMGGAPPSWLVYFAVSDCDHSTSRAESLGGSVVVPPRDVAEVGRFAVMSDPQGAVFAFIKLHNPV